MEQKVSQKIILNGEDTVSCPHCEQQFPLREGLSHHLIEQYEQEYDEMLSKEKIALEERVSQEQKRKIAKVHESELATLKAQLEETKQAEKTFKKQSEVASKKAAEQVRVETSFELKLLQDEMAVKDKRLTKFRNEELLLRKEKKLVEQQKAELSLDVERKLDIERTLIKKKSSEEFSLKEAELKKKISDAQKANEELTRKLEQGSQQLQGEVLELELESLLGQSYPFDDIEPVKKGIRGADVIQHVKLRSGAICGTIVWETKRAENWSNNWIPKLKEDMQRESGDISVLVSTVFPANVDEVIMQYEGVWLVRPDVVSGISAALRTVLIESQRQKSVSVGKNEQMEALFDYVTSNQFAQRIRAVVENYELMRVDLEKEKAAMQRIWKKRETQIGRISDQMLSVCGELQGVSSYSMPMLDNIAGLDYTDKDS
jgi:hypothetical protein